MLSQSSIDAFSAIAIGFAFAGLLASAFEMVARRPLGFWALRTGNLAAVASVPVLVFSGPLVILRNTIRGSRKERRPVTFVMLATVIACFWSMLCGRLVLDFAHLVTQA